MLISSRLKTNLRIVEPHEPTSDFSIILDKLMGALGIHNNLEEGLITLLPFTSGDATVGVENELQTAVCGNAELVDLPSVIRSSNFYKNAVKYTKAGDTTQHVLSALEHHLRDNDKGMWENSWVRFPRKCLSRYADQILEKDLRAEKAYPNSPPRKDSSRFFFLQAGESFVRIPVSYMLKLSLADAVGYSDTPPIIRDTAEALMRHFLNDNTSPEITSFYPVKAVPDENTGRQAAAETLKRYLLTQLLTQYANRSFQLSENGQQALVYFAPHPPLGQKKINNLISDAFYRELFMSPCLSGWNRGEEKHHYMGLCHRVLSLSQLNAVAKLKEAGIITRNLVVLPNTSNTSLANNGTHISLGSLKLSRLVDEPDTGFTSADEKFIGDLVIKITEHFLPLFVNTYSAAPYRFDFWDFHPEKMLGFLPHELDFTHLRMIWRRWQKKASIRFMGRPMTPFGPEKFDRLISRLFRLKGDFIPDVRLVDYLVALLSTNESPALGGLLENELNLKKDLADMGVFDESMPLYMLQRLRQKSRMGFSGFEGRYYSIFDNISNDMGHAVNMQILLTAMAYKYIFEKKICHSDIPDHPTIESERRQIFFGTAIGIPTFYVWKNTKNRMMTDILKKVKYTRHSRRYKGYIRVLNLEYRKALISIIEEEAGDLVDMLGLRGTMSDLQDRISSPAANAASGKLVRGILDQANAKTPMKMSGDEFNTVSETYYRTELKTRHTREAFDAFAQDLAQMDSWQTWRDGYYNKALLTTLKGDDAMRYLASVKQDLLNESLSEKDLKRLVHLLLLIIHRDMQKNEIE